MTLPSAISCSPRLAAATLATSSGKEVPIATMVKPINNSLMPHKVANSTAPQTIDLELTINNNKPKVKVANALAILISFGASTSAAVLLRKLKKI